MDPDGDYESRHSTRSIGDVLLKDAKDDDTKNTSDKKCGEDDEEDEEMGVKPSLNASTPKVLLTEEKEGSIDFKPSAPPPADDLGCLPSAPPLEPSPKDDATAPATPESRDPPEPPGFKEDPDEGGRGIPGSVALPIGLDNADRTLPVASVVPIITDATGAEVAPPPTQPTVASSVTHENGTALTPPQAPPRNQSNNTATSSTRRIPSFPRQMPTHPAPEQPITVQSGTASLANPQDDREKKGSQGWKCTPCKTALCLAALVIVAVVAVGLTISLRPSEGDEKEVPVVLRTEPPFASLYPNCHVYHKEWIGDGNCNGGNYNKRGCGWDGGDCIKEDWPDCHANTPEAFRGLGNGKCNAAFNVIECGYDLGDCRPNWDADDVAKLKDLVKTYPGCFFDGMNIRWLGDGLCDGEYNNAECGYDGGDCEEFNRRYPSCNVDSPNYINDGECDTFDNYNSVECGSDGGDCLFNQHSGKACSGSIRSTFSSKTRAWCQYKCLDEGNSCEAFEFNFLTKRCRIYDRLASMTSMNNSRCYERKNALARLYLDCNVSHLRWLNDGMCDGGNYIKAVCGYDGGDCLFDKYSDKKCNGSVRSTWSNKTRRWCQFKCLDEGNQCKAYDFDSNTDKCRIFSSYSSKTNKNNSKCYKKK